MIEPVLAGLLTKGTPIPLEGVTIDAEIRDICSRVTVTQRTRNREEWELLADKAKAWLSRCGANLADGAEWLAAAAPALTTHRFWP